MTGRIKVLDERTRKLIAAGEVIERPASVVKELVENSLDAGSTRIIVELKGLGVDYLKVVDNGCGMSETDALLSIERHATSKIRSIEDLGQLYTLGFRGEALPSIAAVSKMELTTRLADAVSGVRVRVEGGGKPSVEEVGCPPGTSVVVRELFYNTPARRSQMRGSEFRRIADLLTGIALSRPEVAISLIHDGRTKLSTSGSGDILKAAAELFGSKLASELLFVGEESWPVPHSDLAFDLSKRVTVVGAIGKPEIARLARDLEFFIVNWRLVRSGLIREAVEAAMKQLIGGNKYPVAIIGIFLHPSQVDPNVHPSKAEVRFLRPNLVYDAVFAAVTKTLRQNVLIPEPVPDSISFRPHVSHSCGSETQWQCSDSVCSSRHASYSSGGETWLIANENVQTSCLGRIAEQARDFTGNAPQDKQFRFRDLRPIGVAHRCYVIAEGPDGLYLLDQHAAHERVVYETLLRSQASLREQHTQTLLMPVIVELTPAEYATWEQASAALAEVGLITEEFGGNTVAIRAVPFGFDASPHFFKDVLAEWAKIGPFHTPSQGQHMLASRDRAAKALAACKAAMKANDPITQEEISALLKLLDQCEYPYTCAHGRPTCIKIGLEQLQGWFDR